MNKDYLDYISKYNIQTNIYSYYYNDYPSRVINENNNINVIRRDQLLTKLRDLLSEFNEKERGYLTNKISKNEIKLL